MRTPVASWRAVALRVLAPALLGIVLAVGAQQPVWAVADDTENVDSNVVTISVTIDVFDPCAVGSPSCSPPGGGNLAATGIAAIGVPLGVGALLAVIGAGLYARAPRRRVTDGVERSTLG